MRIGLPLNIRGEMNGKVIFKRMIVAKTIVLSSRTNTKNKPKELRKSEILTESDGLNFTKSLPRSRLQYVILEKHNERVRVFPLPLSHAYDCRFFFFNRSVKILEFISGFTRQRTVLLYSLAVHTHSFRSGWGKDR